MRWKCSSLFLAIALSACIFQVDVIETPLPSATVIVESATSTSVPTIDNSATPLPLATVASSTPEQVALSTVLAPDVLPIVFQANGTSQIVVGSIGEGSSQTYSLRASQGQVMSVSILPEKPELQNTFELEIKGADGAILCPVGNFQCPFWRGVLPSTQEYLIKVIPRTGGVFKLRVAINPSGQANQSFDYADPQGRYTLSYSDEFAPMNSGNILPFKFAPDFALQYIETTQYVRTNLSESYFTIGSSTDAQAVATCTEPASLGGPETIPQEVTINGVVYAKSQGTGVAAGNIYDQIFYRTVHRDTCYEITYFMHYTNIGNYEPGAVSEFDRDLLLQKFDEVLSSLVLK